MYLVINRKNKEKMERVYNNASGKGVFNFMVMLIRKPGIEGTSFSE